MNTIILIIDTISTVLPLKLAQRFARGLAYFLYKTLWQTEYIKLCKMIETLTLNTKSTPDIAMGGLQSMFAFFAEYKFIANHSAIEVNKLVNNIVFQGEENLKPLYNTQRPLIFISIHMGNFLSGFLKLAQHAPADRIISIIKYLPKSKKEDKAYKHFKNIGANIEFFRLDDKAGRKALKSLKQGNIVFTLVDLPTAYSNTTTVNFFGKTASWPNGPVKLAMLTKAIIMPVVCFKAANGQQIISIEKPIDPTKFKETFNHHELELNIMQELVTQAEKWIRQYPEQWHFWSVMETLCTVK